MSKQGKSAPPEKRAVQKAAPPRKPAKPVKPAKPAKRNGHAKPATKGSELDRRVLELVQAKKSGIGARDLAAALKIKPEVASYRLHKLRDEKKLRTEGATRNTVYLPIQAQA